MLARVFCESPEPECKLHKGRSHGFVLQLRVRSGEHHRLTAIGLESNHVSFAAFVRMARSLRRVRPVETTTVHLTSFLSDDGKIWCGINTYDGYRWCTTDWPEQYGALRASEPAALHGVSRNERPGLAIRASSSVSP